MKDWIAAGVGALMLALAVGPLLVGRHITRRRRAEPMKATGVFYLPDAETEEPVRVDVDGEPLTEADLSARTAPQEFTVDPERLAEVLQLEVTGEYVYNRPTWVECDAAEQWLRDPLGSALLPPLPLIDAAGNPALADAFFSLFGSGMPTTDWSDADSEFRFWDSDIALPDEPSEERITEELAALVAEAKAGAHR